MVHQLRFKLERAQWEEEQEGRKGEAQEHMWSDLKALRWGHQTTNLKSWERAGLGIEISESSGIIASDPESRTVEKKHAYVKSQLSKQTGRWSHTHG